MIAHRVAVGVIDDLEPIKIDEQHRAGSGITHLEQLLQVGEHLDPVGQAGEGIVDGLLLGLSPRRPVWMEEAS